MRAVLWSCRRHLPQHGTCHWASVLDQLVEHAARVLQQGGWLVKLLDLHAEAEILQTQCFSRRNMLCFTTNRSHALHLCPVGFSKLIAHAHLTTHTVYSFTLYLLVLF